MNCRNCGNPIMPGSGVCSVCGTPNVNNEFSTPPVTGASIAMGSSSLPPQQAGTAPIGQMQMPGQTVGQGQFSQPPMPSQPMGQGQFSQPPMPGQPMGQGQFSQPPMPAQPMGQGQFSQSPMHGQPVGQMPGQPMPANGVVSSGSSKKNKAGKIVVIIVLIAIVAAAIGGALVFSGALEKKDSDVPKDENKVNKETVEEPEETNQDLSKLVTIKEQIDVSDGSIFMVLNNASDKVVNTTITITFYDSSNASVGTTSDFVTMAPKSDGHIYIDKYYVIENSARYEVGMTHLDYSTMQEIVNINEDQLIKNDTGKELTVQYTNTRSETISRVGFMLLCYSNDTLVRVKPTGVADVASGAVASQTFSLKQIKKESSFDRYEILTIATIDVKND